MTPEIRNWLTRHALVVVDGRVPVQTLLEVPEGLFAALEKKSVAAGEPPIAYIRLASNEGIALTYTIRHGTMPASALPYYEVYGPGVVPRRTKLLAEALVHVRQLRDELGL